jgi:hypothetical protein
MRIFLVTIGLLLITAAVLVLGFEVPVERITFWISRVFGILLSMACPLYFLLMFLAPGIGYNMSASIQARWERMKGRRAEIEDLTRRINHLRKPHLMAQLAGIYLRQGRHKLAAEWYTKALEHDGTMLEARYRLAECHLHENRPLDAMELLEQVHTTKPDHDYGGAYLRLAQASERAGREQRASEVFAILLRFYPGHPEGSFCYGLLLDRLGKPEEARKQMEQVIFSVRNSPPFQRRRNRHWMWKAKWWLWRNRPRVENARPGAEA